MKLILRLAACTAALFATLPALAQEGDVEKGRLKVYTCTGCHGIEGYKNVYPHYHVPKIGGQNYEYLVIALTAYKNGERKHPTMQAQAESFSAEDIADIARYLSTAGHNDQ
ncbi:c-type cytochrome [Pseudomarimonas salicorniae]|uniref:Cytochrome c n=1 Tax=Pseudomarimonas salicorniae TaxID=2933270 RepID=A0ABT0GLM3_9GAMM|nr:cytochrome c [Lysobacter sp. CAU 1642]MCK7594942.1 cytochrome c [Lysobacter sp. CAU 1642]